MGLCAEFQSSPKESHLKATKRILRYLKGMQDLVLYYPSGDNIQLLEYANADYVEYLVNRNSTSGTANFLGSCLISWGTKKQTVWLFQHKRIKHIYVRHHFSEGQCIEKFLICMKFWKTEDQVADIFTKALSREHFERNRLELGLIKLN
ncbi:secreted RxLR effector protein 161-like [Nicotiana sylvestris]|uniref:secreted RxLR effector protein 161-like n=1 Tax=Nicotiana sylvestris TaxID=4096 RepID=UPI00388CAB3E